MELLNGKSGLNHLSPAKIDISVLKLLGFETFANFLRVSVSENLVSEKKSWYRFRKIWYQKKSLGIGFGKFDIEKKTRYRFWSKFWYRHSVATGCLFLLVPP